MNRAQQARARAEVPSPGVIWMKVRLFSQPTRREVWAWTVLLSLASQLLIAWLLLGIELPADERWLTELKLGVYLGSSVCILGVCGWAYEASKRPR